VPLRAVSAGQLDRFGVIDPTEGGNTQRHSLYATWRTLTEREGEVNGLLYAVQYRLNLFSNFTFFNRDPDNGDLIEQHDARTLAGLNASYRFRREWRGMRFDTTLGAQPRTASIDNGLHYDRARERLAQGAPRLQCDSRDRAVPQLRLRLSLRRCARHRAPARAGDAAGPGSRL
jgi:hypothetical protein